MKAVELSILQKSIDELGRLTLQDYPRRLEAIQAVSLAHCALALDRIASCLENSNLESDGIASLNSIAKYIGMLKG